MAVRPSGRVTASGATIFEAAPSPSSSTGFVSQASGTKGKVLVSRGGRLVEQGSAADIVLSAREQSKQTGETETQAQRRLAEQATGAEPGSTVQIDITGTESPTRVELAAKRASVLASDVDVQETQRQAQKVVLRQRASTGVRSELAQSTKQKISVRPQLEGRGGALPGGGLASVIGIPGALGTPLDFKGLADQIAGTPKKEDIGTPRASVVFKPKTTVTKGFESDRDIETPIFQTTLKEGAKSVTIFERERTALSKDKGFFGKVVERLDKNLPTVPVGPLTFELAGVLPGGVSKEEAKISKQKSFLLASDNQTKKIVFGQKVAIASGVLATAGAGLAISKSVGAVAGAVASKKAITAATIASSGLVGFGIVKTTQKLGDIKATKFQKEILGTEKGRKQLKAVLAAGKQEKGRVSISDSTFLRDVRSRKGKQLFDIGARAKAQELGFKGGKLEEVVSLAKQRNRANFIGKFGAIIGVSGGSELLGRNILKVSTRSIARRGLTGAAKTKAITRAARRGIGVAGIGEAVGTDVALTTAGDLKFNPFRTAAVGFGGGVIASAIGTPIVRSALAKKPKTSTAQLLGAYIIDPTEPVGDALASFSEFGIKKTAKGIRNIVNVPVGSFTFTATRGKGTSIIKTKTNALVKTISKGVTVPVGGKTTFPTAVRQPLAIKIPQVVKSVTSVKSPITIPTSVKSPVSIRTPTSITTATSVGVPTTTTTPVSTPTSVPVTTSVPVAVPTLKFPFIIPFGGGAGGRGRGRKRRARRTFRFTPSVAAKIFNIKGKTSDILTGLEIRKILVK